MNKSRLRGQLITDEGNVGYAYQDSEGYWTIGVGHLIDNKLGGLLDDDVIELQLDNDIDRVEADAMRAFPWYQDLSDVRQEVILNMVFNLGITRFKKFRITIDAIASHDFETASQEMLDSKWSTQVGTRSVRLSEAMRTGEW